MKGIIFDIKRFSVHDGPGIRTTVFMKGCPLHCWWCHNPESISMDPVCVRKTTKLNGREFTEEETIGYETTPDNLLKELRKEQIFMEESGGGVTFSGGEPLLQYRFLMEILKGCKDHGLHTAIDTTAYSAWEVIRRVADLAGLFLIDLKLMNDRDHQKYTGVSNLTILENIRKLDQLHKQVRIRIPVIPEITATPENIRNSISFLQELNGPVEAVDLLPFHNMAKQKYHRFHLENQLGHKHSMNKEDLSDMKAQFEAAGFNVKIGG